MSKITRSKVENGVYQIRHLEVGTIVRHCGTTCILLRFHDNNQVSVAALSNGNNKVTCLKLGVYDNVVVMPVGFKITFEQESQG